MQAKAAACEVNERLTASAYMELQFIAEDLPGPFPLSASKARLTTFIALFPGSETEVPLQRQVVSEIDGLTDTSRGSQRDTDARFSDLDATKLDTTIKRLEAFDLLRWDDEDRGSTVDNNANGKG